MRNLPNKQISHYALILCLGIVLLFGQAFKLHMHLQHDEVPASFSTDHSFNLHVASLNHNLHLDFAHQDETQNHHSAELSINSDGILKKISLFNPIVLFFIILSIILSVNRLHFFHKRIIFKTKLTTFFYFLHPQLRAPPRSISI